MPSHNLPDQGIDFQTEDKKVDTQDLHKEKTKALGEKMVEFHKRLKSLREKSVNVKDEKPNVNFKTENNVKREPRDSSRWSSRVGSPRVNGSSSVSKSTADNQ